MRRIYYLKEHPEKRADDLIEAYSDQEVDMILCAIGGDDTYRLLPYLFEEDRLKKAVNDKPFLGLYGKAHRKVLFIKMGKFMICFYMRS